MRSKFTFLALLLLLGAKSSWVNAVFNSSSEDCAAKIVVCNCNVNQDSHVSEAINALDAKLEKLIALVTNTSPPTPQPTQTPGKLQKLILTFMFLVSFSNSKALELARFQLAPLFYLGFSCSSHFV